MLQAGVQLPTVPGLREPTGYFWPSMEGAWRLITNEVAKRELRTQIEAGLAVGIASPFFTLSTSAEGSAV
jgi:hypothetical protein